MALRKPFNKQAGAIFPPPGSREGGARVDFRTDIPFANQIEWHGVRWAWSRMTVCPCKGFNDQTDQTDPGCLYCNALGWRPIQTTGYVSDKDKTGQFTPVQQALITKNKAMVIRGIATSMSSQPNMFSVLGNWGLGTVMVTVRPENKLGYYDRLVYLDDVMPYSEIVTVDAADTLKLHYPAEALNALSETVKEYGDADVVLTDDGNVQWLPGKKPAAGTRLSVHYLCHPTFVVIEFPHLIRSVDVRQKPPAIDASPMGSRMALPIQVVARLEHLPLELGA